MTFIPKFADEHFAKNVAHWYSASDPSMPPHFITPHLKSDLGQKYLFAQGDSIFAGLLLGISGGIGGSNIACELKEALSPHKRYLVKFRVAVPPISRKRRYPKVLPENFGVLFSGKKIVTTQQQPYLSEKPQVDFAGTALQPFQWIELARVFQPKEAGLKFLTLGTFCPNPVPLSFNNYYYYFIDRVSVIETQLDIAPLAPVRAVAEFKPAPVYFGSGQASIAPFQATLDSLVHYLQIENPEIFIQLTGYADAIGTEKANLDLSQKRALAVYAYLLKKGVDSTRMQVRWAGEIQTQQAASSTQQMAQNRRVDFVLTEPSEDISVGETPQPAAPDWQSVYRFSADLAAFAQHAFTDISFTCIGEYEHAVTSSGTQEPESVLPEDAAALKQGVATDAISYLLKRAEQEKIILLNEAHNRPKHRAFVALLLKGLYERGYRHLGLEMLFPTDTTINTRGYALLSSGLYLREPVAGELVRMAMEMGYDVFGYDATAQEIAAERIKWAATDEAFAQLSEIEQEMNARDRVQANKIAQKMTGDAQGKHLILAGFGHIRENITGTWQPMAYQLKTYHQINPFSVDQITGDLDFAHSPFKAIAPLNSQPMVVLTSGGQPFSFKTHDFFADAFLAYFDLQVVHPKTQNGQHGRPTWLEGRGLKKAVAPSRYIPANAALPCLVLAYVDGEYVQQAVPADVVECRPGHSPCLMLRPGSYAVFVKCEDGQIFKKKMVVE